VKKGVKISIHAVERSQGMCPEFFAFPVKFYNFIRSLCGVQSLDGSEVNWVCSNFCYQQLGVFLIYGSSLWNGKHSKSNIDLSTTVQTEMSLFAHTTSSMDESTVIQ
jgi:hypothetical protein